MDTITPKPIPDSHRRVTPTLVVDDGVKALEFYGEVFDATGVDVGIVVAVDDEDTATSASWAPTSRPVRPSAGVYTGMDGATTCGGR
jgi:hypothetical protein